MGQTEDSFSSRDSRVEGVGCQVLFIPGANIVAGVRLVAAYLIVTDPGNDSILPGERMEGLLNYCNSISCFTDYYTVKFYSKVVIVWKSNVSIIVCHLVSKWDQGSLLYRVTHLDILHGPKCLSKGKSFWVK